MIHKLAAKFYFYQLKDKAGEQAYHYLRGRELSDETIVKFGLGYSAKFSDSPVPVCQGQGVHGRCPQQIRTFSG